MISRRHVLNIGGAFGVSALLSGCAPSKLPRKRIALTLDDFDLGFSELLSPKARNAAILQAFAAHNHKAAGFVTGKNVDTDFGREVVSSWSEAGHLIGNHTWSHKNSSQEDIPLIQADILKNHDYLSGVPGYEKIFRFPFLAEGGTPEKVALYREFLNAYGFANAPVTIDSLDWFISARMEARLQQDAQADIKGYGDYYIQFVLDVANQKEDLARRLGYNELPHALLIHHNILNGVFLEAVMDALALDGWDFVDAREMFAHPLYSLTPQTPNRGRSVLSVLAQEAGIAHNYPKKYYGFGKAEMERLGL